MPNVYANLTDIVDSGGIGNDFRGPETDLRIMRLAEAVSRQIDNHANRYFYTRKDTLLMEAFDRRRIILPEDLVQVFKLEEDVSWDETWSYTWRRDEYVFFPYNARPMGSPDFAKPYQILEPRPIPSRVLLYGRIRYRLEGEWGYSRCLEPLTGVTITLADATTRRGVIALDGITEHGIAVGDTLFLNRPANPDANPPVTANEEQVYVTATEAARLTLTRGANEFTADAFTGTPHRVVYPSGVREACVMQTARLYSRRISGFTSDVGFGDAGQFRPVLGLDKDVQEMLSPYRNIMI